MHEHIAFIAVEKYNKKTLGLYIFFAIIRRIVFKMHLDQYKVKFKFITI